MTASRKGGPRDRWSPVWVGILAIFVLPGCALVPEKTKRDRIHNPFPQMKKVAILPFFNQSENATLDVDLVTEKYYSSLQAIPGFEVLPVGVTRRALQQFATQYGLPTSGPEFQAFARFLDVEAVIVGSVTDYEAFYPPRMAMTAHWYAADDAFHPIPAGYGLPWGTDAEKRIPRRIVRESEFELARAQLSTQVPESLSAMSSESPAAMPSESPSAMPSMPAIPTESQSMPPVDRAAGTSSDRFAGDATNIQQASHEHVTEMPSVLQPDGTTIVDAPMTADLGESSSFTESGVVQIETRPAGWPDVTNLIPDPPSPLPPPRMVNHDPVLAHTKIYAGNDPYFTDRLSDWVDSGDDARPGGWQGYLRRSDDFIQFCCHLHIVEMLESRGGRDQSDLILRWRLSRY